MPFLHGGKGRRRIMIAGDRAERLRIGLGGLVGPRELADLADAQDGDGKQGNLQ
ncbi:hypothetical protein [Burkholderia gladioli]|uniref:hypothetical protein n=1 Tax=Burkholderia gladioli TaxID=28095 RepID=UPI001FC8351D|nr:hypothetical protein [Burkholderia gladioli]